MFILAQYMMAVGLASVLAGYCDLPVREEEVPVHPPSMRAFGAQGEELTPRIQPSGEFSNLKLRVSYILEGTAWVPESTEEAAFALREMLPADYYTRLLAGYSREWQRLMMSDDVAANERVGDVARYLKRTWGTDWSGRHDEFEMLADIVDYSTAPHVTLPQPCACPNREENESRPWLLNAQRSTPKKLFDADADLPEDGAQRAFGHVAFPRDTSCAEVHAFSTSSRAGSEQLCGRRKLATVEAKTMKALRPPRSGARWPD